MVWVFLGRLLNHGEERRRHFLAINNERATKYFVTAVLRVDLCKAKHLRVGELAAELLFYAMQIFNFGRRESKAFLLVVALEV